MRDPLGHTAERTYKGTQLVLFRSFVVSLSCVSFEFFPSFESFPFEFFAILNLLLFAGAGMKAFF